MENCIKPVKAKKYCAMHHQRWRRHGDPNTIKVRKSDPPAVCQWVRCEKPTLCKGYCAKHYYIQRMMKS
ncbi:hypothetical protein NNL21_27690 [Paenibacillus mendelii]|nr:hypothetical protein [Paenibacillus mendelii]